MQKDVLSVISLFSGALGLDLGLEKAGFKVRVAVENDKHAANTIRLNRPDIKLVERDIEKVKSKELLKITGLKVGEVTLVSGGPSCQTFSTAGRRNSLSDPRGKLIHHFIRIVKETQPRFFVMENVRGLLSAARVHRPLRKRGHGFPVLDKREELGSAFAFILRELKKTGYYIVFDVLNTADFGTPQTRHRVVIIGSRDGEPIQIPNPTHSLQPIGNLEQWVTLKEALKGLEDKKPQFIPFSPKLKKYLKLIPEGGNWRDLPKRMQKGAMGKAYDSWGGRVGFFRRLNWDSPSPALTTHPVSKATLLCHPTKLRPLSVKEYSRIQQFPDSWEISGGISKQYTQVGNAVPVGLGYAIGKSIRKAIASKTSQVLNGIVCENKILLERLSNRPRTMVNPARMRKVKSAKLTSEWINHRKNHKHPFLKYIQPRPLIHAEAKSKGQKIKTHG